MKTTTIHKTVSRLMLCGIVSLLVFGLFAPQPALADDGNISPGDTYAWSEHAGWLNFRPTHGGVTVYADHVEGYAWAENIGWVKLGADAGGGNPYYANTDATNWGVNRTSSGELSGFAWSENAGWINFNPSHSQVTIDPVTGEFDGYAWAENVGWVHFKNDTPAYGVKTTFTLSGEVAIEKSQTADETVLAGETFFYELAIQNSYDGLVDMLVTDILSEHLDYVDDTLEIRKDGTLLGGVDDDLVMAGDSLSYRTEMSGIDLLTIAFEVKVSELVDIGTLIINQAFVTVFSHGTDIVIDGAESNLVQTEVVPEPATMFLFGIGLFSLAALIRRRRRKR